MGMAEGVAIALAIFGVVVSIIGYFLAQKDAKQAREIDALFTEYRNLQKELTDFKIHVAGKHYEAQTVDAKFDKLEQSVNKGFQDLGVKFDKFFDHYLKHIGATEDGKC